MTKEKPLSEKVILIKEKEIGTKKFISRVNLTKDVAEAVESEEKLLDKLHYNEITWDEFWKKRDEIFGDLK